MDSIVTNALLLTAVNLLLRSSGTGFQVFLARQIGAEGMGLLHLILSVNSFTLIAGMGGVRTASMYLSAEELGKGKQGDVRCVLRCAFRYAVRCSLGAAAAAALCAPWIAERWIGSPASASTIRLCMFFLPVICLGGVLSGIYTAKKRILFLAGVEIAEQVISISATALLLLLYAKHDPIKACQSVVTGSGIGAVFCTLVLSFSLKLPKSGQCGQSKMRLRLRSAALPLALGDIVRTGLASLENLMVPKRLSLFAGAASPLADFGRLTGMVFPIVTFPGCLLFGLCEVLIPEMAQCKEEGRNLQIHTLSRQALKAALLYGSLVAAVLWFGAEAIGSRVYRSPQVGPMVRLYAPLIPMLYCDMVTDAMTKGLGQQKICLRYNIFTSALDICFLFILLPRLGLNGYYFSFVVTHGINFALSLRRLLVLTKGEGIQREQERCARL